MSYHGIEVFTRIKIRIRIRIRLNSDIGTNQFCTLVMPFVHAEGPDTFLVIVNGR